MALNANNSRNSGGMKIDPMDEGSYPARVVQVIDLGLQPQPAYQGKEKEPAYSFALTYEFVDEFMKDEDGNDIEDKPRWLTESMPLYGLEADRAKSTHRYNALDPAHVHGGDFSELLSTPCLVTVVHNPRKGGGVYENIGGVTAMRPKDQEKCPKLVNEPVAFDLADPDLEVFGKLPKWMQEKIKGNLEFKGSKLATLLEETGEDTKGHDEKGPAKDTDDGDETPY